MKRYTIDTSKHSDMIDITAQVEAAVKASGVHSGIAIVQSLHTTAGITVNENADPDVVVDFCAALMKCSRGNTQRTATWKAIRPLT